MVQEPDYLKAELKRIGRLQYHRLRRVAAMLHYYRIDTSTIEERLVERGCSRELASWIVETASNDTSLARKIEDSETPEPVAQVVLKGLNGVVTLIIVYLLSRTIQLTGSMGWLFVLGPILLIASLIGSLMILRAIVEIRRRATDRE
jgi:hypothetical protein